MRISLIYGLSAPIENMLYHKNVPMIIQSVGSNGYLSLICSTPSRWPTLHSRICRPHVGRRMITKFILKDQEGWVKDAAIRTLK